jgi:Zn-dependent protease
MSADRLPWPPSGKPFAASANAPGVDDIVAIPTTAIVDPLTLQAARILENPPPEQSWVQGLIYLVISLFIFAAIGVFQWTPIDLVLLVAILFLHEAGHYLGMRLFNYQDVKMFFIPLFGAAVSGRSTSVEGYKEAIVLLLGPLPGIFLGLVLGIACFFYDSAVLRSAATMLIWINGFNLLPLMPLDGGRVLHLILFSRQRHVEAAFRVLTAALLGLWALAAGAWGLGIFAVLLLIGTPTTFQIARLATQLRGAFPPRPDTNPAAPLPHELAVALIERVRSAFPQVPQPANLATLARQVWERIHLRPPGVIASILLLALCGATIFVMLCALFVFNVPIPIPITERGANGAIVRKEQTRVWGRLLRSKELAADGVAHGRFVEYFPHTDKIHREGAFARGQMDGLWTTYHADGQIESQQMYGEGVPVVPPNP